MRLKRMWKLVPQEVKKIMVLYLGQSEIVVNSYLEDLEGRMRLKRMWKLVPQAGKQEHEWR